MSTNENQMNKTLGFLIRINRIETQAINSISVHTRFGEDPW